MNTARLNNYRQSPRKVRLVTDMVRGKKVAEVIPMLDILNKRAAVPVKKLLQSAVANAVHNANCDKDKLLISEIRVDEGVVLKRQRARARGRAFPIRKHTSRITVSLKEEKITPAKKSIVKNSDSVKSKDSNK